MAPQFVKPYVKSNKNDANDAEAICEAMSRPSMRLVSVKSVEQQDIQAVHRVRAALVASVGTGEQFKKGREMAVSLGLTPKQHSTGGKERLLGISKRGDPYLRSLLVHGGRAVVRTAKGKEDRLSQWVTSLEARSHRNVAAVANVVVRQKPPTFLST